MTSRRITRIAAAAGFALCGAIAFTALPASAHVDGTCHSHDDNTCHDYGKPTTPSGLGLRLIILDEPNTIRPRSWTNSRRKAHTAPYRIKRRRAH